MSTGDPTAATMIINGRFEIKDPPIGQGGMGIVYRAYDSVTRRYVALKTVRGEVDAKSLALFEKEWSVLAGLSHPNIIDIIETGQYNEGGRLKPYFVMPFLAGMTLDQLMQTASQRLNVDRVVDIIGQTCRGLQAAHDQGLIHRDIKPSNIFVLNDDSVKIIDFGVAYLANAQTATMVKGTLQYLAPELLVRQPPSVSSDIFALGVVCYEALTGRKPFERASEDEVVEAIRKHIPAPANQLNAGVNQLVSRTIHKAMAKQPWQRFSSAREFGDTLRKALRNEPIEYFDPAKIQPRLERVKKARAEGDYQLGKEILSELEAEGHIDDEIPRLRAELDNSLQQKAITNLLDSARTRIAEEEFLLALQKVQEALALSPQNAEALELRAEIERRRSDKQVEGWYGLVQQHLDHQLFAQARMGIDEILKARPGDPRALELQSRLESRESQNKKAADEKEEIYRAALENYRCGEVSTALDRLEKLLALSRENPSSAPSEADSRYEGLYNQIRSEREAYRNAYGEARRRLESGNLAGALEICSQYLQRDPGDAMFAALKLDAEERLKLGRSAAIAEVGRRVNVEADLDRKIAILNEARTQYPDEPQFEETLRLLAERRDLVNAIATKARQLEEDGRPVEAMGQWDILRNIYPQYPGIDENVERLNRVRSEISAVETRTGLIRRIDQLLEHGETDRALAAIRQGQAEYPGDADFTVREQVAATAKTPPAAAPPPAQPVQADPQQLLLEGKRLCASGQLGEGIDALRSAHALDPESPAIRNALASALVYQGRMIMAQNGPNARDIFHEAATVDPDHPIARQLYEQAAAQDHDTFIESCIADVRRLKAEGNLQAALARVEEGRRAYPAEETLMQLHAALLHTLGKKPTPSVTGLVVPPLLEEESALPPPAQARKPESPVIPENPELTSAFPAAFAASAPVDDIRATRVFQVPDASALKAPDAPPPPRTANIPPPPVQGRPPIPPGTPKKGFPLILVAAVALVLLLAGGAVVGGLALFRKRTPAPQLQTQTQANQVRVKITANIPGAKFFIDGQPVEGDTVTVTPGEQHKLQAVAEGYHPYNKPFVAPAGESYSISCSLFPALPDVRLTSDLKSGTLMLNNDTLNPLQAGEVTANDVAAGQGTLKVVDGKATLLAVPINIEPTKMVTITGPVQGANSSVIVVTALGSKARIHATPDVRGAIGTNPAQPVPPAGLELNLEDTPTEFTATNGQKVTIAKSVTPVVQIYLTSGQSGLLELETNAADAQLKVNGFTYKSGFNNGRKSVTLSPGKYKIQVSAADFEPSEERMVTIEQGKTQKQAFNLKAVSKKSMLALEGAEPGAEILIDGEPRGTVSESGAFMSEISPGQHRVSLRKNGFEDSPVVPREFRERTVERISGRELALARLAVINFSVKPDNAKITFWAESEGVDRARPATNGRPSSVRPRGYFVKVEAPGYDAITRKINVEAGKPSTVDWTLAKAAVAAEAPKPARAADPVDTSVFTQDGKWWSIEKPVTGSLRTNRGVITLEIEKPGKKKGFFSSKARPVEWYIDENSAGNRIKYRIEGNKFTREQTVPGALKPNVAKAAYKEPPGETITLVFDINPNRVIVRDGAGNELDSVDRPNPGAPLGRVSFLGPISLAVK